MATSLPRPRPPRPPSDAHILEITLISAQDIKKPHGYAVLWVHPSAKLRTHVDRAGGGSPTWNDKFLFEVPTSFLSPVSSSAVHIEIYASGYLVDSLVGSVRFLVGNQRLLGGEVGIPAFAAVGIRRLSGRFQGILNVGSMLLSAKQVSAAARKKLERRGAAAVGVRKLVEENEDPKFWRLRIPPAPRARKELRSLLKDRNFDVSEGEEKANGSFSGDDSGDSGGGVKGWFGYQRKIHQSSSDQNLRQVGQRMIHLSPSDPNLLRMGGRESLRSVMDGGD